MEVSGPQPRDPSNQVSNVSGASEVPAGDGLTQSQKLAGLALALVANTRASNNTGESHIPKEQLDQLEGAAKEIMNQVRAVKREGGKNYSAAQLRNAIANAAAIMQEFSRTTQEQVMSGTKGLTETNKAKLDLLNTTAANARFRLFPNKGKLSTEKMQDLSAHNQWIGAIQSSQMERVQTMDQQTQLQTTKISASTSGVDQLMGEYSKLTKALLDIANRLSGMT